MLDIYFHGQACVRVKGRDATIVFDPYDPNFVGLSPLKVTGDIVCVTHDHRDHNNFSAVSGTEEDKKPFVIAGPGEYEISGVTIVGVPSFHDDREGAERGKNTIYNVTVDEVNIVHLGDLGQKKLSQEQVEALSTCDVLFIPVGSVYTISGRDAPDIISQIEPKIIVPIHYKIDGLKFPLDEVGVFLKAMGKENIEPLQKLSVSRERLPEEPEIVLLQKQ